MSDNRIPVSQPCIGEEEIQAVVEVLESGKLASGEVVEDFEHKFSEYVGKGYGVATSSGTTALITALMSIGIGNGDEVICPAYSFFSTASMISACGATPVFSDIYKGCYSIDVDKVEDLITTDTRCIIAVHMFGREAENIEYLSQLCDEYNLTLIVDSCQAPAPWSAQHGGISCYSFYATKNLTTGEGGMLVSDDEGVMDTASQIISHGQCEKYKHVRMGFNFRMTNIAAAIGVAQLSKIDTFNTRRMEIAALYKKMLGSIGSGSLTLPHIVQNHVFHQYAVEVYAAKRPRLQDYLSERGIDTAIHYPVIIPQQPIYRRQYKDEKFPVSLHTSRKILSLPCNNVITDVEIKEISENIVDFLSHKRVGVEEPEDQND
jgi:perosamine synthetase